MMRKLMSFSINENYKFATLCASSDSGYRIYNRLDFSKVGELVCYEFTSN